MNDILLWKMKNNLIEISWGIKPKLGPFSIRSWKLWAMVHRCRKHFPSIRSMWPIWKLPGRLQLRVRVVIRLLIHQGMRVQRSPENQRRSQPKKPERLLLHQGHLGITIQFDCLSFMPPEKRKGWISKRPKNSGITAEKREIFWLPSRLLNLSAASLWRNLALPTLGQNCPSYIYIYMCVLFHFMPTLHQRWGQLGRVQIPNIGSSRWHSMFKIQIVWGKKSSLRIGFMAVSTGISVLPGRKHGLSETPKW